MVEQRPEDIDALPPALRRKLSPMAQRSSHCFFDMRRASVSHPDTLQRSSFPSHLTSFPTCRSSFSLSRCEGRVGILRDAAPLNLHLLPRVSAHSAQPASSAGIQSRPQVTNRSRTRSMVCVGR
ncbi:predicted protein [Uncinocarpus reesii 1704]|uniref:Uncharacterized protein n=1 Tax=Uncinocarpus reesii (strain UAMH 1704) TaxID=336963 RepID=C4JI03_UNCRE|nr:uncharacterized protein UREG_01428 [Uncinocarpus reesii 1704]EEP76579.1 predicted protein [Uncinocarpus reesii 1704]